jgi:adenylate cyclase
MSDPLSSLRAFLSELQRRRVFRVAAVYAVVAWLIIQIAETTFPYLGLPAWAVLVIVLALLGDRAGAIRAYRHYLAPRYDPEPALRPEVERVRAELVSLESGSTR